MFSHDVISVQLWQGSTKRKKDLTKTMLGAVIADSGPGDIWGSDRNMAFVAAAASTTVHAMVIIFCPPCLRQRLASSFLAVFPPRNFYFTHPNPPPQYSPHLPLIVNSCIPRLILLANIRSVLLTEPPKFCAACADDAAGRC